MDRPEALSALPGFQYDSEGRPRWHAPLPHPTDPHKFGVCQLCGEPWPCLEATRMTDPVPVTGIWLRHGADDGLEVLAEIEGRWRTVIPSQSGEFVSYIVEALGMRNAPGDRHDD